MVIRASQPVFSGGEIAPEVQARSDVAKYATALRQARNVLLRQAGGVVKRQGTLFQGYCHNELQPVRLLPFQYSSDDQLVIELGDGVARFIDGGGYELEADYAPTAITQANPGVVTFANHGLSPGDDVYWSGVSGMAELNGQTTRVGATTANTFEIQLDTTSFSAFTGAAGQSAYVPPSPAPPANTATPPSPPPPSTPPSPPSPDSGGTVPRCVAPQTLILLADGREVRADALRPGVFVRTQHEITFEWGNYEVLHVERVEDRPRSTYVSEGKTLIATPDHRIVQEGGLQVWTEIQHLFAQPFDRGPVMQITVAEAHTYVSNGILSHNIKYTPISGDGPGQG